MSSESLLEIRGLIKRFGGITALKSVDFTLAEGEVHALCGENGAGKSTLIKVLGGLYPFGSYEGEVRLRGKLAHFEGPRDSSAAGIAVIYQELALVPEMTVAENLLLGTGPKRYGLLDWNALYTRAKTILEQAEIELDPATRVAELGVGQRQLVEIARAIGKNSKILILDEPTAALTDQEVIALLKLVRRYRDSGISCIYISHKLDEVFAVSNRITVLRDGSSVTTLNAAETQESEVIRHMVGREITELFPRRSTTPGDVLLEVRGLSVAPERGAPAFLRDIGFEVRAGEVLGIGGLMGAGRSELLMHLFGVWGERTAGSVRLLGKEVVRATPETLLAAGMALVSEDRKRYGLILESSIGYHLTLSSLEAVSHLGLIDAPREHHVSRDMFHALRIKAPNLETPVAALSGGNQQKVVLGKALNTKPKVLLLDEPTRGIDVGAKLEVYGIVNRISQEGTAVVLVSSELPELLGMSDRIIILHEGKATGPFQPAEVTQERLLAAAMGKLDSRAPSASEPAPERRVSNMPERISLRNFSMAIALLVISAFFAFEQPVFLSARNLSLLSIELSVTAILALGMLLVLLPGHIDLSAGSGVGLTGALAAVLVFDVNWPAPAALVVSALLAVGVWAAMGAVIVRQKIPAFIITLGGLLVFKGLHWLTIRNQTIPVVEGGKENLYSLLTTYYLPPVVGIALAVAVIGTLVWTKLAARARRVRFGFPVDDNEITFLKLFVVAQLALLLLLLTHEYRGLPLAAVILGGVAYGIHVLTQHTPFGRYLYAVGGNEEAARVSGVPIERTVVGAFGLMGLIVALGGFMQTAYSGASTSTVGSLMELDAVAACVIGGASLRGGRGTVPGVIFGALIMATLLNGLTLMAVSPEVKYIARGVVLALAVWVDVKLAGK